MGAQVEHSEPERSVLVVSPDAAFVSVVAPAFERERVDLVRCIEAQDAVKAVLGDPPDLVLFDLPTQGLSAEQALRLLRGLEPQRYVPVILVPRALQPEQLQELISLGADAVVPADQLPLLAAHVHRLLRLRQGIRALAMEAQKLETLSITDGLTQLFNHRFFQDRLREEFRRAQRYDDPLALVLVDLDHFKAINDTWGHPVGDQVLHDVGEALRRSVRETDVVCRYGGEEFCAILPKTHLAGAITVAERIWRELGSSRVGPGLRITGSLGVSGFPGRGITTPEQLLRAADEALYRAKTEGRNRISLHVQAPYADSAAKAG